MIPWDRPLTNIDITNIVGQTALKNIFRGTFSRNELHSLQSVQGCEAGILNLSKSWEEGTHWTAWFKHLDNKVCYFDSFGDLPPPRELIQYLKNHDIFYNIAREQAFNTVICGQLSLCFLFKEYLKICL
jgi:hypothetical protein